MDLVGLDRADDVLQDADALVIVELRTEVGVARRVRDLDNQLGNTIDESPIHPRLASAFRQDANQNIGLGFALEPHRRRGIVQSLDPQGVLHIVTRPYDRRNMGEGVGGTDRTGHEDDSVDELGPDAGWHRLVKGVERPPVESLAFDECGSGHPRRFDKT